MPSRSLEPWAGWPPPVPPGWGWPARPPRPGGGLALVVVLALVVGVFGPAGTAAMLRDAKQALARARDHAPRGHVPGRGARQGARPHPNTPGIRPPAGLSFTDQAGCAPAGDYASPRLDRRVRQLLATTVAHHRVRVSCLHAGHSWFVAGTRRVSNHSLWRAVDLDQVDGRPVGPSNPAARELAGWIGRGGAGVRPSEVGSPWDFGRRPWFTNAAHQDHLHVGFAGPTQAGGGR